MVSGLSVMGLIICLLITLLQLLKKDHWIIRFSDFPHAQLTILTALFLTGLLMSTSLPGSWYLAAFKVVAILMLTYQLYIIFPYTILAHKQSKDAQPASNSYAEFSIMEANVYMDNECYDELIALVQKHQPDILITLESDQKWEQGLSMLEQDYIYTVKCPFDNTYGMHLYSKLELKDSKIHYLVEERVPSIETNFLIKNKEKVRLHIVHPKPPSPTQNETSTERDAELIMIARRVQNLELPVIVAGDLNDVAWSHTTRLFQRISRLLDPRIGRGFFNTFHVKYPLVRWPLDHIFHSRHFLVSEIKRLSSIGSDHFPMFIRLSYAPTTAVKENGDPAKLSDQDLEESEEKVKEAKS